MGCELPAAGQIPQGLPAPLLVVPLEVVAWEGEDCVAALAAYVVVGDEDGRAVAPLGVVGGEAVVGVVGVDAAGERGWGMKLEG